VEPQALLLRISNQVADSLLCAACSTPTRRYWSSWTRLAKQMIPVAQHAASLPPLKSWQPAPQPRSPGPA